VTGPRPAPTIGADVHYVWGGECVPAKVVHVGERCELAVLLRDPVDAARFVWHSHPAAYDHGRGVALAGDTTCGHIHTPSTWHWPRRV